MKNNEGLTSLMVATLNGNVDVVKALLEKKVDINVKDKNGKTALALAEDKKFQPIVKVLKKAGAK